MPHYRPLRKNLLTDFFGFLIYLLVAVGFCMIAITGQISLSVSLLFLVPFLGSLFSPIRKKVQLTARRANLYTWIYLPFFLADMVVLSRSFVPATLHLILFIQVLKLYQPKNNRDYFQLILLAFLLVLAASSLTISSFFLVLFLIFVFLSLAALICFEVKRSVEALPSQPGFSSTSEDTVSSRLSWNQFEPVTQWKTAGYIMTIAGACFVLIVVMGMVLFFAIPRFGAGFFQRSIGRKLALSGFSDRIRLGNIGSIQLDPSVVMRVKVEGNAAGFRDKKWRGVSLDYFDGTSWSKHIHGAAIDSPYSKQFQIRNAPTDGLFRRYQVLLEPASTNYLFTLDRIIWLSGNLYPVRFDPSDDSITATYRTNRRLSYQAVSAQLTSGSNSRANAPLTKQARDGYLQLPTLEPRIAVLARSIVAEASTVDEKAGRVELYLQNNFQYSLDAALVENPQLLSAFLFETRKGHCEYFSTAMAVLLRTQGIPTRIVNGFHGGVFNAIGEDFIFRGSDAHSWVEVFDSEQGWRPYDPTPSVELAPIDSPFIAAVNNYLDAFELFWGEWILGYDDILQVSLFLDLQEKSSRWREGIHRRVLSFETRTRDWAFSTTRKVLAASKQNLWVGLLLPLAIPCWLLVKPFRRFLREFRIRNAISGKGEIIAVEYYRELLEWLRSKGWIKPPYLTPSEFAETIQDPLIRSEVTRFTLLYYQIRFSPDPVSGDQIRKAYGLLSRLKALGKNFKDAS
jgi:transglutaminase-like putative cysteine protease